MPHKRPSGSVRPVTGAILTGGLSTRMGKDKASLRLNDGRTILERVAAALQEVCEEIVVVGAPGRDNAQGLLQVEDVRPGCGPLGGIEALLASGISPHGEYLVCPCDVPLIKPSLLSLLLAPTRRHSTAYRIEGKPVDQAEPLPARINAAALPVVRQLLDSGKRSVWILMDELQPEVVGITVQQAQMLRNINTMEDYREIAG